MAFGFDFLGDVWAPVASHVAGAAAKTILGKGSGAAFQPPKHDVQRVNVGKMGYSGQAQATPTAPAKVEDPTYVMNMWINRMNAFRNIKG